MCYYIGWRIRPTVRKVISQLNLCNIHSQDFSVRDWLNDPHVRCCCYCYVTVVVVVVVYWCRCCRHRRRNKKQQIAVQCTLYRTRDKNSSEIYTNIHAYRRTHTPCPNRTSMECCTMRSVRALHKTDRTVAFRFFLLNFFYWKVTFVVLFNVLSYFPYVVLEI